MGNFLSDQIVAYVNPKITDIGAVDAVEFGDASVRVSLRLNGEVDPVQISVSGVSWESEAGCMRIHYEKIAAFRPWVQGLVDFWGKKTGNSFVFKETATHYPLRMIFPKYKA
ncbi:MAG: hypothetical protein LBG65_01360 [Puniceicoccales bacterium]|nr:hypothetical protein [Puniceicoccales bacterium]